MDSWHYTALEIEDIVSDVKLEGLTHFVADVLGSFDTVDRGILDCALDRMVLLACFRNVYFVFHQQVRLRFWLPLTWSCLDTGMDQSRCPLSMVFAVALKVSADDLKGFLRCR